MAKKKNVSAAVDVPDLMAAGIRVGAAIRELIAAVMALIAVYAAGRATPLTAKQMALVKRSFK